MKLIFCLITLTILSNAICEDAFIRGTEQIDNITNPVSSDQNNFLKKDESQKVYNRFVQYILKLSQESITCDKGMYEKEGICEPCGIGRYQDQPGQTRCIECPNGFMCPDPASSPIQCQPGTYRENDATQYSDASKCLACERGMYQDKSGQTVCRICPDGYTCYYRDQSPVPCSRGRYRYNGKYITDADFCSVCPTGTYQDEYGKAGCKICPSGYYCYDVRYPPKICYPGSYRVNDINYLKDASRCISCELGQYQDKAGSTECEVCPDGYRCPEDSQPPIICQPGTYRKNAPNQKTSPFKCFACEIGSYQDEYGQIACQQCPSGYKCPDVSKSPIKCEPGTYRKNDPNQSTDASKCVPCEVGKYQDKPGQTECVECPDGYICPDPSVSPNQCWTGTYRKNDPNGQTDVTKCVPCGIGRYSDNYGQSKCSTCPKNHRCPEANEGPIPCEPGTFRQNDPNEWKDASKCIEME